MTGRESKPPGRWRRWTARLGLMAVSGLAGLAVVEASARAAGLGIPPRGAAQRLKIIGPVSEEVSPGQEFALIPGKVDEAVYPGVGDEPPTVIEYRINSLGFRDGEYERRKPDGTYRIAVLGDSFTFGTGVALEDTYPELLEQALSKQFPGRSIEVMNWGVYAYNTRQQAALLRRWIGEAQPDQVLMAGYINDASGEERGSGPAGEGAIEARIIRALGLTSGVWDADEQAPPRVAAMQALRRSSVVADVLGYHLYRRLRARLTQRGYLDDWSEGSAGLAMFESSLVEAMQLCEAHGADFRVAFYPDLHGLDGAYPFEAIHRRVGALCAEHGIPFYDLLEPLRGLDGPSLHAHAHDHHPNGECNRIVARWLAQQLAPTIGVPETEPRD